MFSSLLETLDKLSRPDIDLPVGASIKDIFAFESRFNLQLPKPLLEFLQVINGAYVGGQSFLGINSTTNNEIGRVLELIPLWAEKNWIPIASDGCGNYFVMISLSEHAHPICFVDHERGYDTIDYVVSSCLEIFAEQFILQEINRASRIKNWFLMKK